MYFNVGIELLILKTFDAVLCLKDIMRYQITSLYRAHITDF